MSTKSPEHVTDGGGNASPLSHDVHEAIVADAYGAKGAAANPAAPAPDLGVGGNMAAAAGDLLFTPVAVVEGAVKGGCRPVIWAYNTFEDGAKNGSPLEIMGGVAEVIALPITVPVGEVVGAAEGLGLSLWHGAKHLCGAIGDMWEDL